MNNDWWDYLAHGVVGSSEHLFPGRLANYYRWSPKEQVWKQTSVSDSELSLSLLEKPNYLLTYIGTYGKQAAPYWYVYLNRHIIVVDGSQPKAFNRILIDSKNRQKARLANRMKSNNTYENIQKHKEKAKEVQAKKRQPIRRPNYV